MALERRDPGLRIGVSVDVEVVVDLHKATRVLPTAFILGQEGQRFVYVVRKGRSEKRWITPGLSNWERTEILEG